LVLTQYEKVQTQAKNQAGNPAWDDFNKRRNATIREKGFTTKESAKGPATTVDMSQQASGGLSQDATNAYLKSIGVASGGSTSAPQYAGGAILSAAPQYVAAPLAVKSTPQYAAAAPQYAAAAPLAVNNPAHFAAPQYAAPQYAAPQYVQAPLYAPGASSAPFAFQQVTMQLCLS